MNYNINTTGNIDFFEMTSTLDVKIKYITEEDNKNIWNFSLN